MVAQTVKNPPTLQETGLIPGLGTSPGEGDGNPLRYYCLEKPMDREAGPHCGRADKQATAGGPDDGT